MTIVVAQGVAGPQRRPAGPDGPATIAASGPCAGRETGTGDVTRHIHVLLGRPGAGGETFPAHAGCDPHRPRASV
ncbi:hypothetical protein [Streptomyces sp. KL116D]|uniref:hypothetical protein n=1 Tax=Streptomyces sp. KL116D TaxID=3045152 RepID=UPI003555D3BA